MGIVGVDFFGAAGGATKGFQNAGIKILKETSIRVEKQHFLFQW
jgi:site-specific DNA-cytosine methylase